MRRGVIRTFVSMMRWSQRALQIPIESIFLKHYFYVFRYATSNDLIYPLPLACLIILFRFLVENKLFRPIGRQLGIKEVKRKHPGSNEMLEKAFQMLKTSANVSRDEVVKLAKQLDMSERRIEHWFRQRALFGKPSQLDKFAETGWRWIYYTGIFIWGLRSLWTKTWFWNIRDCW